MSKPEDSQHLHVPSPVDVRRGAEHLSESTRTGTISTQRPNACEEPADPHVPPTRFHATPFHPK